LGLVFTATQGPAQIKVQGKGKGKGKGKMGKRGKNSTNWDETEREKQGQGSSPLARPSPCSSPFKPSPCGHWGGEKKKRKISKRKKGTQHPTNETRLWQKQGLPLSPCSSIPLDQPLAFGLSWGTSSDHFHIGKKSATN
jgi:hypothetical protein